MLTYFGGNYDDLPWGLALDSSGNVYVGGNTLSTDFPVTNGALQPKFGGADLYNNSFFNLGDGFVTKLTNDLSAILYSTYLGGTGDDAVTAITVDGSGNAYVTGGTTSQNLGTSGALQHGYNGPFAAPVADQLIGDAFVAKINPDGKSLGFFTYLGGNSDDVGMAIALDASGNIVVTGSTQSLISGFERCAAGQESTGDSPGRRGRAGIPFDPRPRRQERDLQLLLRRHGIGCSNQPAIDSPETR